MNKQNELRRNLGLQLATAGVSALLLASPVSAQSGSADQSQQQARAEFIELDKNEDQKLEWRELEPRIQNADLDEDWGKDKLMSEFDENNNDALEPREFQLFVTEVGLIGVDQVAGQQREIELESANVKVDPGQPQVSVTQQSPNVQVQQGETDVMVDRQAPDVTVRQPKPEVTVTMPRPEVQVEMPKPEVEVSQPNPDIKVEQSQPDVRVQQQKPEVNVSRGEPDVEVVGEKPQVVLQREKPDVRMADDQEQANVRTRQADDRAQIQVEQSEPQVAVSQAEPDVSIESVGQSDVNVQRAGEEPDLDLEELEAPAAGISSEERQTQQMGMLESMSIDELTGHEVLNSNGEELGEVDQVVVSEDQGRAGVVLSMGGILGMGAEKVMAPLEELVLQDDLLIWETSMTKDELEESARYQEENYTRVTSNDFRTVGELRQNFSQ